ncbi:MAG: tandem-95 repeat protein, partial [Betaproteobacteria bacterium]|nr:tandem-95 repeat protein [Betaproteobacteria bacterium]
GFVDTLRNVEQVSASFYADTLIGGIANEWFEGRGGADSIDGGGGSNTVSYFNDTAGVTVKLGGWVGGGGEFAAGYAGSATDGSGAIDVFKNIQGVIGSNYADVITGDANDNRLDGRGGNDTIDGGAGNDWVVYNQAMQGVRVDLSQGKAFDDGQGIGDAPQTEAVETDTLISIENVQGGWGNDSIVGSAEANELQGGAGSDTLDGGAGNDTLVGGAGNDSIIGGDGSDTAVFTLAKSSYKISVVSDQIRVEDISGGTEGVDLLSGIETFKFADQSLSAQSLFGLNATPIAASSTLTTLEDKALVLSTSNFAFKDSDQSDSLQEVSITALPTKGSLTINAAPVTVGKIITVADINAGKLLFTPAVDANGATYATVGFKVSDGKDWSTSSYVLTIGVTAVNDAPVFANPTVTVAGTEDTVLYRTVKATDVDAGDRLTYAITTQGKQGTVTIDAATGAYVYKPVKDANGTDSFVVTATDSANAVARQTVNVTLAAINDAPTFASTSVSVTGTENNVLPGTAKANDVDAGDTLTYAIKSQGNKGAVTIDSATGAYTYTPKLDAIGADSFVITATDSANAIARQTVNVTLAAVNNAPTFASTSVLVAGNEDNVLNGRVKATDRDAGDTLTYATTQGTKGAVSIDAATGAYIYTPIKDANGTDSFVITATDSAKAVATLTVKVTLSAMNDAPTFAAASVSVNGDEDTVLKGTAKATDVDGDKLTYAISRTQATKGEVTINPTTGEYVYTPVKDVNVDSFVITARDSANVVARQTVNVTLAAVNDAPIVAKAVTTPVSLTEGTAFIYILPRGTFKDVDDTVLTYSATGMPNWMGIDPANGKLSGTPGYNAADTAPLELTIKATDAGGLSAKMPLTVNVINTPNIRGTSGADSITAGLGNDSIRGGVGNDTLVGGAGNDLLTGQVGADRFVFDTILGTSNIDTITDFVTGTDKIVLSAKIFSKFTGSIAGSAITTDNLVVGAGATAQDKDDYLIYDTTTDLLSYDADGSGTGAAVAFV